MVRNSKKNQRLERIEKLITALKNCPNRLEIFELGQIEHDWLFANYKASSAGTFFSSEYLPTIDAAFPASAGDELLPHECWQKVNGVMVKLHLVVKSLKPTISEWDERNQTTLQSTVTRINSKLPLYPQPLIEQAISDLDSDSWAKVAAALILLTGRRPTEIAWSAQFAPQSDYSLIFSGQLKKGVIEAFSFEIPTLIEANQVLLAFNRLRQLQGNKTQILQIDSVTEATKATNSQINRAVYQNFSDLLDAPADKKGNSNYLSASNLRAAYGKIASYFYCPPTVEPILYVSKILGHKTDNYETDSLATTIHYYTYRIVDKDGNDIGDLGIYQNRLTPSTLITNSPTIKPTTNPITETKIATHSLTMNQSNTVTKIDANLRHDNLATEARAVTVERNQTDATVIDFEKAKSGTQLAELFNVSRPTIGRNRKKGRDSFAAWSAHADPNGTAWQFISRGKLEPSNHIIDIYLPIERDDPIYSQLTKLNENKKVSTKDNLKLPSQTKTKTRTKTKSNDFQLLGYQIDRFQSIADRLSLIGNSTQQFNQLLDWAESQLHSYQPQFSSRPNNEELITKAIETIANFSENLNNTLTPLTEQLQNLIQSQKMPQPLINEDNETETECLAEAERISLVEQNRKVEPLPTTVQDPSCLETPEIAPTSNNALRTFLDSEAIKSTIDSLNTSIALKRSAIAFENKKRSKADTTTIKQWQREIERLDKSIDFLSQLEPR